MKTALHPGWVAGCAAFLLAAPLGAQLDFPEVPTRTIGVGGGDSLAVFGRIADVEGISSGRLAVLDKYSNTLTVFDTLGTFLFRSARAGQGPGELADVSSMSGDHQGVLYVADNGNGRISVYDVANRGPRYVRSFRPGGLVTDLCALSDRLVLLTHREDRIIRMVSMQGEPIRTFGMPVEPQGRMAREMGPGPHPRLSSGRLACVPSLDLVLYASEMLPTVRAYSGTGQLRWETELPDFATVRLTVSERFGTCCVYGVNAETGTVHTMVGLATARDRFALVSIIETVPPEVEGSYELLVLDVRDGSIVTRRRIQGGVVDSLGGRLLAFRNEPVPRVLLY